MLRLMRDGERPRVQGCGFGRAPLPATWRALHSARDDPEVMYRLRPTVARKPLPNPRPCISRGTPPRGSPNATVAAHEIGATQVGDAEDEGDEAVAFVVVAMSRMRTQLMAR